MNQKVLDSITRLEKAVNRRISTVKLCLNFLRQELLRCVISLRFKYLFSTLIRTSRCFLNCFEIRISFYISILLVQVNIHDDESSSFGELR